MIVIDESNDLIDEDEDDAFNNFGRVEYIDDPTPEPENKTLVNWDGEVVPDEPWWGDTTLFTVGDVEITAWHATTAGIIIIVLSVIVGLICCYISWRKRK